MSYYFFSKIFSRLIPTGISETASQKSLSFVSTSVLGGFGALVDSFSLTVLSRESIPLIISFDDFLYDKTERRIFFNNPQSPSEENPLAILDTQFEILDMYQKVPMYTARISLPAFLFFRSYRQVTKCFSGNHPVPLFLKKYL